MLLKAKSRWVFYVDKVFDAWEAEEMGLLSKYARQTANEWAAAATIARTLIRKKRDAPFEGEEA